MKKEDYIRAMELCIYGKAWQQYLNFRRDAIKSKKLTPSDLRRFLAKLPENVKDEYFYYFKHLY